MTKIHLNRNSRLLFIGDSITDCGRREEAEGIGSGYPRLIRDYLRAKDPENAPVVLNTGVSGNRITDLQQRWQKDVLDLKPDMLSIKIGINDVWHGLDGKKNGTSLEVYTATYRNILKQLRSTLPTCALVLCEPSVICPPASIADGNKVLKPYVQAVNMLAQEYRANMVIPLHNLFLQALAQRPDLQWTNDGVHPTTTGHMLIARAWLATAGLL